MAYTSSGWTYTDKNEGYVDLLDNSGEITYSPVSGICGGIPNDGCATAATFQYNIGLVDWTMGENDPCNIVKAASEVPSCNQEMLVCWFNDVTGDNKSYSEILTDYGAEIFVRKNIDECNHIMIISGDPSTLDYSNYQFVHGIQTQYFSTDEYVDSGHPLISKDPNSGNCERKYSGGTPYDGHKIKYLPNTDTISGGCITDNLALVELYFPNYGNNKEYSGCTIRNIYNGAFSGNANLSAITLNAVEYIGLEAFNGCSSLVNIDWGHCTCKSSSVKEIGNSAFYGCGLTNLTIPNSVENVGTLAFAECHSLSSCTIGSGVTSIGENAFQGCSGLTSIVIPDNVTSIGNSVFVECTRLTSCTIGSGITSISEGCFYRCYSLLNIDIPSNVKFIDYGAFGECANLLFVTVRSTTPPLLDENAFYGTDIQKIYVPSDSVEAYKNASGWSSYRDDIEPIR